MTLSTRSAAVRQGTLTTTQLSILAASITGLTSLIWGPGELWAERGILTKRRLKSKTIEHVYYTFRGEEHHGRTANR
jgi:hypothetical protein